MRLLTQIEKGENIVLIETIIIRGDNTMKKFFFQYRAVLSLVALLLLVSLVLGVHYDLIPLPLWVERIVPRMTVNVTAAPISTISKPVQIIRTGSIENPKSASVYTEFSGQITEIYVTEGQSVTANQPLFKILHSSEPEGNKKPDTAAMSQDHETNPQAQINYDNLLTEYNRLQKLYEQGAIPRRQVEAAANRLQAAKDNLTDEGSTPTSQSSESTTIPASSSSTTTINAATSGKVLGLSASLGKTVETGQQLMFLDVGELQATIRVEQKDLYSLHPGTPATIEVSEQYVLAQVASIYPEVGENNIPSFRVQINIPNNTGGLLKTGMSVNVRINTAQAETVHTLPMASVFQDNQGLSYIYLVNNGKALRQQIRVGEITGDSIEITSKLPEQILVITSNINNLRDGDNIMVSL